MTPDTVFSLANMLVLPGWALLILLPRWKWTLGLVCTAVIPIVLGVAYLLLFASQASNMPEGGGFGSLAEVTILFSNPALVTAGWLHYLAFDLFIGAWEVRDSQNQQINHILVVPCLLFTFMLGPIGLSLYLVLRWAMTRQLLIYQPVKRVI